MPNLFQNHLYCYWSNLCFEIITALTLPVQCWALIISYGLRVLATNVFSIRPTTRMEIEDLSASINLKEKENRLGWGAFLFPSSLM